MRASLRFFNLMQRIGNKMHEITSMMSLVDTRNVLDLCMISDEYSALALKFNPQASVSEATLSKKYENHKLFVRDDFRDASVRVWQDDLTSLVKDMSIDDDNILERHSNFENFQKNEIWARKRFDLVFCDDQVLRNHSHNMMKSRQRCEARRLICSQLLIALRHIEMKDSMMILLHKIDRWDTVSTIRIFDRFASITLFKLLTAHKFRSSFYLVAKNIQSNNEDALKEIQDWTKSWKNATFHNSTGENACSDYRSEDVILKQQVTKTMNEFDERLITLRENAWKIQKETIEKSSWFKESKIKKKTRTVITNDLAGLSSRIEGNPVTSGRIEQ